eukprot:4072163-Amphidinium_carterae.1
MHKQETVHGLSDSKLIVYSGLSTSPLQSAGADTHRARAPFGVAVVSMKVLRTLKGQRAQALLLMAVAVV